MKGKCLVLIVSCFSAVSLHAQRHIDLAVFLEPGKIEHTEMQYLTTQGSAGAIVQDVMDLLNDGQVPAIIHSSLILILFAGAEVLSSEKIQADLTPEVKEKTKALILSFKKAWAQLLQAYDARINKAGDFVVAIPRKYFEFETFESLGFREAELEVFWKKLADVPFNVPLSVDTFKNLFNTTDPIQRRFYVSGHGTLGSIAGMNRAQYISFLNFINPFTDFLVISTCYAGGINLVTMYEDQIASNRESFSKASLQFPIAISASPDTTTNAGGIKHRLFFKKLDLYLARPGTGRLKEALAELYIGSIGVSNIPVICFPGMDTFFRALEINQFVQILTVTNLAAYELEHKQKGMQEVPPLELSGYQGILLYSADITEPLKVVIKKGIAQFVSMIPGNAFHIIDQLIIPTYNGFMAWHLFRIYDLKATKAFYIKYLQAGNGTFENVAIRADKDQLVARVKSSTSNPELNGKFVFVERDLIKPISDKQAYEFILKMVNDAQPNPEALRQATGGQQTVKMLNDEMAQELEVMEWL